MQEWVKVAERVVEEFRPLLEAFEAYDRGVSEEEIKMMLRAKASKAF